VRAETVEHALDLLAEGGDEVKLLAGGQSFIPMLNLRLARPTVVVDIDHLDLAHVSTGDGGLELGCLVRHRTLEHDQVIREQAPLLARCAREIGHVAIRNRGTIGGSICHADPTAELGLAALTLRAEFVLWSRSGHRSVSADDFFVGPFMTAARPDELLSTVRIPSRRAGMRTGFQEFAERSGDFALAAAACRLVDEGSTAAEVRIAIAGAGSAPQRLPSAEAALEGARLAEIDPDRVADAGMDDLELYDDGRISAEYRRHLLREQVRSALAAALDRAEEPG
jgi:carbon-monoxide dehydrogenase medium subunit